MTQEEKAKAYDEALETARQIHNGNPSSGTAIAVCEQIFPQLRESEDERIRKKIIEHLEMIKMGCVICTIDTSEEIAWLEKQKEPKKTDLPAGFYFIDLDGKKYYSKEFRYGDMKLKVATATLDAEKQKEQKPNIEICPHSIKSKSYKENGYPIENCDYGLEIALAILEKTLGKVQGYQTDDGLREHQTAIKAFKDAMREQKPNYCHHEVDETGWTEEYRKAYYDGWNNCNMQHEQLKADQKPVEWSEEDETRLTNILIMLKEYMIHHYSKDDVNKSVDWLKALPERFNLQPKPAWSEKDEKVIDTIVSVLGQYIDYKAVSGTGSGYATPRYSKEIAWLKSLRQQPKQEWNEKDEDFINMLILHFNYLIEKGGDSVETYKSYREKLKSLRPGWKPSEEQMNALQNAVALTACDKELVRLYNQLKKL